MKLVDELPIVDVSALVEDGAVATEETAAAKLRAGLELDRAFREHGFLYVTGHGVPRETMERVLAVTREFMALPQCEKDAIEITAGNQAFQAPVRGYQRVGDNITEARPDQHEAIDFYRDCGRDDVLKLYEQRHPMAGCNKWPETPPAFADVMRDYVQKMLQLGRNVMEGIARANDIPPQWFSSFYDDSFWVMRTIRYPDAGARPEGDDTLGCGRHTDYGCVTFVLADDTPGCLQVQRADGTWMDVPRVEDAFVVNCGDMLSRWTQYAYRSTPHRVLRPVGCERVSVPFFFEPNFDAMIRPLPNFWAGRSPTSGQPCDDQAVRYGDHLAHRVLSNFKYSPELQLNGVR